MTPRLSIALTGRNDDYGKDFPQRFLATLRFNHRELTARGVSHEFVLSEWAPDPSRPLLADLVNQHIPDLRDGGLSAVVVDARYQDALSLNPSVKYLEFPAKNVAIRRATGQFVLSTNADVFLGREVLAALAGDALQPRTIYRAVRTDLKEDTDVSSVTWDTLEDPRNLAAPPRPLKGILKSGGTGDFILLDRDTFHELRGFNEVYRQARVGIDANFMVKAYANGADVAELGGPVYHVNHEGSYRSGKSSFDGREADAPWGDRRWPYYAVVYDNPPNWGLADAPTTALGPGRWRLDFSWKAVPPLVDLQRVVLPVDRVGRPQPPRYRK